MAELALAAGLAAGALSRGPADLAVAPSQGLATLSIFGLHLALSISEGPHRLDQVGLETDTRAPVTFCAGLAVVGTLSEGRAAAEDGISLQGSVCGPGQR